MSGRRSGSRVESRTYAPPKDLADVVHCFWVARWDLRGQAPHVVELLADPCVNVAFEADEARIVGVSTRLWRRELHGAGTVRAVKLRAGAGRALLGHPLHGFTDRITPLEDSARVPSGLREAVLDPRDESAGLGALACWVRDAAALPPAPDTARAAQLVQRVAEDSSITGTGRLAQVATVGARALQRLFRDEVGASPKWVIRRYRLQEAALRLERGDAVTVAALAAELGYADHAHLTRDFAAATGRTPTAFAREVWE